MRYDGAAWDRSRHKRRVAFVEQEDALLRDLTVRQTLTFAAALRGARDAAASAAATLKALGLESCADQAIGGANVRREISGGQRRRVTIGHELLLDPGLVLLDEPTSGLDSHAAAKIFALLVELKNGGPRAGRGTKRRGAVQDARIAAAPRGRDVAIFRGRPNGRPLINERKSPWAHGLRGADRGGAADQDVDIPKGDRTDGL